MLEIKELKNYNIKKINRMEKNLQFSEEPKVTPWGNEMSNVPLNVKEETVTNENGEEEKHWSADVLRKVKNPVNKDNIVDAAIAEKFDEATQKRIMRNFAHADDAEVAAFNAYVAEVTKSAEEAGY